jgi:hypothetical protein
MTAVTATRRVAAGANPPKLLPRSEHWYSMESAPKDRLILIKTHVKGHTVAVTGQYSADYGGFVTLALGHHIPVTLYGHGWLEIPEIRVDVINNFETAPPSRDLERVRD